MYTSFYGLKSKPFQLTPDPDFLFLSNGHRKALTYLEYGIVSDSGGFILVSGEVGTGKTTIIRSMMKGLKEDVIFSRINNTRLTSDQLIAMINDDFGLDTRDKDKTQRLRDLTDFLIEQYGRRRKSILIIDEAQNLSPELLEEIRLLSNLETDKSKLLQIIMVGQPELRKILAQPELRSLRQRITVSCQINPLTRQETEKYIYHRLAIAGNSEAAIFQDGDIDLIHNFSRGIPRLINIVCDFLLVTAYIDKTKLISLEMVKDVIGDLEKENRYWEDEIPERYRQSTGIVQEMQKNAGDAEVIPFVGQGNDVDRAAVFEMMSENGKIVDSVLDRLKTDVDRLNAEMIKRDSITMDIKLKEIITEIRKIKSQLQQEPKRATSEIGEGGNGDAQTKEDSVKRLWSKIFHKRRLS